MTQSLDDRKRRTAADAADSANDEVKTLTDRVIRAARVLERRGSLVGRYFLQIGGSSIATQRQTKDQLPATLRESGDRPQIVTVRPRGMKKGGSYLIIPLEKAAEALEAQTDEEPFVPITVSLREIDGHVQMPEITRRGSGRPRRAQLRGGDMVASEN